MNDINFWGDLIVGILLRLGILALVVAFGYRVCLHRLAGEVMCLQAERTLLADERTAIEGQKILIRMAANAVVVTEEGSGAEGFAALQEVMAQAQAMPVPPKSTFRSAAAETFRDLRNHIYEVSERR